MAIENQEQFEKVKAFLQSPEGQALRESRPDTFKGIAQEALDFKNSQTQEAVSPITGATPEEKLAAGAFNDPSEAIEGLGQGLADAGRVGATMASGALTTIAGGIYGLAKAAFTQNSAEGVEAVRAAQRIGNFATTPTSAKLLQEIGEQFEFIDRGADWLATNLSFGNPYAATIIYTTLVGGPEVLAGRAGLKNRAAFNKRVKQIEKTAADNGINLDALKVKESIVRRADEITPDAKGVGFNALREEIVDAKKASATVRDDAYRKARQTKAYIGTRKTRDLAGSVQADLIDQAFDVAEMPLVQRSIKEIADLDTVNPFTGQQLPPVSPNTQRFAPLNNVDLISRRINKRRKGLPNDAPEAVALSKVKRELDNFVDNEFNARAISGEPEAQAAWAEARGLAQQHIDNFSTDKFIRQMMDQNATPETMQRWLSGASVMAANKQAGQVVRRLKGILGEDHPSFVAIKQDLVLDLVDPLLQETPNFKAFIRNYDKTIKKNPTLVRELGLDTDDLRKLRNAASAVEKVGPGKVLGLDMTATLSRLMFGHGIAKAAVRVSLGTLLMDRMLGVGKVGRQQIIAEMGGVDFKTPLIPRDTALAGAIIASEVTREEDDNEDSKEVQSSK